MKIAFYAPMKSPLHSVPSGDRRVGRLLMKALEKAGYEPELASELRVFDKTGDPEFQEKMRQKSLQEIDRLLTEYQHRDAKDRPVAWFTYHVYHKAPDWIGPQICKAFDIPYLVAEASHAPKRAEGPWGAGYRAAEKAISSADRIFYMTRLDGECLKPLAKSPKSLCYLPPFIDQQSVAVSSDRAAKIISTAGGRSDGFNLLSVAMMRGGDKLESYRQLAQALDHLDGDDWQLIIVGDGEEKETVKSHLSRHGDRVIYTGMLELADLFSLYRAADLYVWPAHGEAYGMAFLEAQINGLPVAAGNIRGVPDVVENGKTGLLSAPGDMKELASKIRQLLSDTEMRQQMGQAAAKFVQENRSIEQAAHILSEQVGQVIA